MSNARNIARLLPNASGQLPASNFGSEQVVNSRSYNSGYGAGAYTAISAATWSTIHITGTGRDSFRPVDNPDVFIFNKKRSDSHLRVRLAMPVYSDPATSGCGIRVQCLVPSLSNYMTADNYFTLDAAPGGMADGWGASGYGGGGGGSGGHAGIINIMVDSRYNPTYANEIKAKTGNIYMYFQGFSWVGTDTHTFGSYLSGGTYYNKFASWVVEEYVE